MHGEPNERRARNELLYDATWQDEDVVRIQPARSVPLLPPSFSVGAAASLSRTRFRTAGLGWVSKSGMCCYGITARAERRAIKVQYGKRGEEGGESGKGGARGKGGTTRGEVNAMNVESVREEVKPEAKQSLSQGQARSLKLRILPRRSCEPGVEPSCGTI